MSDEYKGCLAITHLIKQSKKDSAFLSHRNSTHHRLEFIQIWWESGTWLLLAGQQGIGKKNEPSDLQDLQTWFQNRVMSYKYENWLGIRICIHAKAPPTKYSIPQSFNADKRPSLIDLQRTRNVSNQELFENLALPFQPIKAFGSQIFMNDPLSEWFPPGVSLPKHTESWPSHYEVVCEGSDVACVTEHVKMRRNTARLPVPTYMSSMTWLS